MKETIKKSLVGGLIFSLTAISVFLVYATIGSTWTNPGDIEASSGGVISATKWNQMLVNMNSLNERTNLIGEQVVNSDTDTVTVSGLDYNLNGPYKGVFELNLFDTSACLVSVYFNGIISTNYSSQQIASIGTTTTSDNSSNTSVIAGSSTAILQKSTVINSDIGLTPTGYIVSDFSRIDGSGTGLRQISQAVKTNFTVSNITSITLKSNVAGCIKAGTRLRIYKK